MRSRLQDYAKTKQVRVSYDRQDVRDRHHDYWYVGLPDNVYEGTHILR